MADATIDEAVTVQQDPTPQDRSQRVARLFIEAIGLPPDERAAFVSKRAADDPAVRDEVMRLLAADAEDVPTQVVFGNLPTPVGVIDDRMPERIGKYEIIRKLGAGGMGIVYLGRHPMLARPRAIKVLPKAAASNSVRIERLRNEGVLLDQLHENVACLHDIEETDKGRLFLVLEYVEGETLAERLERGPLEVSDAIDLCLQVARGLSAAHGQGVIHRDIKPGNIMITPLGVVKILDFGLARHLGGGAADPDRAEGRTGGGFGTRPGMGTPGYRSPEQITGEPQDHRTDIFAFGCVLYECLTGMRAFPSRASPLADAVDLSALPESAGELTSIITECLHVDQQRRPSHMSLVVERLEGLRSAGAGPDLAPGVAPGDVPASLTTFVGRTREMQGLLQLAATRRLLTVIGHGGCGKTRIACELAERLRAGGAAVRFVDLTVVPRAEPGGVLRCLMSALGIAEQPGMTALERIVAALREEPMTLVLDNCEHVITASAYLSQALLQACPRLRIIATSREPLRIHGEQVYDLQPLPVAHADPLAGDSPLPGDAEALFLDRATLVDPHLTLEGEPAVTRICLMLDGLPLAIELAAASLSAVTLTELERRLSSHIEPPPTDRRDARPRQRTLHATVQWSYSLLEEHERVLLRSLGLFRAGFTVDAAAYVSGTGFGRSEMRRQLSRLAGKSLLRLEGELFRLYEPVRMYALERLGEHPADAARSRRRLLGYYLDLAESAEPHLGGRGQDAWLDRLDAEHGNLLAAIDAAAADEREPEPLVRLVAALHRFWYIRSHLSEGRSRIRAALGRCDVVPPPVRARILNAGGVFAWLHKDFAVAEDLYRRSLDLHQRTGSELEAASVLSNLGVVAKDRGDEQAAYELQMEAASTYERLGQPERLARARLNLAALMIQGRRLEEARTLLEACLDVFRRSEDRHRVAVTLHNLAEIAFRQRRDDDALPLFRESLEIRRALRNTLGITLTMLRIAMICLRRSEPRRAAALLGFAERCRSTVDASLSASHQAEHDEAVAEARGILGPEVFRQAWRQAAGWDDIEQLLGPRQDDS